MRVRVRYFAAAREARGLAEEHLDLPDGSTAAALLGQLCFICRPLDKLAPHLRLAVDHEFVDGAHVLSDGAEVALIPPVAGGAGRCRISADALSLDAVVALVSGPGRGGVVTFTGAVRDQSRGKQVVQLEYEAYAEMAERVLERICADAHAKFGAEVAIHHRVGVLAIGEVAVAIAAASAHRAEAFDACRYAIEQLKQDVPIWKKERYQDGDHWVGLGP